jgi:hypothetical protein
MSSTHPWLDLWKVHTLAVANDSIPFCSLAQDCTKILHQLVIESSKPLEAMLISRMWCHENVAVPDYFLNAATLGSQDKISADSHGQIMFTKGVCTCDIPSGYQGNDCSPNALGLINHTLFAAVFLWLFYLFIWVAMNMYRGDLASTKRRKLAIIALAQFGFQMLYLSSWWNIFPIGRGNSRAIRTVLG